jgi:23S rRNA-intervening sequence protein
MAEEMIVFARCYDLLAWLMPKAEKFPRAFRFTVTQRLMDAALDLQEALFEAQCQRTAARVASLRSADAALGRLRLYLRLAHQWHWLSSGQFEHVSAIVAEIGRLLGGWLKQASR